MREPEAKRVVNPEKRIESLMVSTHHNGRGYRSLAEGWSEAALEGRQDVPEWPQ